MLIFVSFLSGGPSAAVRSAAVGAVLLALIEGIGICITRMTAEQFKPGTVIRTKKICSFELEPILLQSSDWFLPSKAIACIFK